MSNPINEKEYYIHQSEMLKAKLREEAENRGETVESDLSQVPDRKPWTKTPDRFLRKAGEATEQQMSRINEAAKSGDKEALEIVLRAKGQLPEVEGSLGIDLQGNPKEGYTLTDEETKANEIFRSLNP
jgi:hypothetical protein